MQPADPKRVLVAEDDDAMRAILVEALKADGYQTVEASDGGRMLVALARELAARAEHGSHDHADAGVDLVVSDVRMPVCSGLAILEQLRAARWHTPVILMTGFGDEETRAKARALDALLFDKPFELGELRSTVSALLARSSR